MNSGQGRKPRSIGCKLLLVVLATQVVTPDSTDFSPAAFSQLLNQDDGSSPRVVGLLRGKRALHIGDEAECSRISLPPAEDVEEDPIDETCILCRSGSSSLQYRHPGGPPRHRPAPPRRGASDAARQPCPDSREQALAQSEPEHRTPLSLCRLIC
ncbi:hypothetical protein [Singulisphaera sp. PoT]|uniref:hypothetical protein n=1 Tax=Singulisphaera sp. PoT TaxID=3411797 RepID=UPI003BF5F28E